MACQSKNAGALPTRSAPTAPRTRFTDPALIRLLAQLSQLDGRGSQQAFAERLGQWFHWTDASALSAALDTRPVSLPVAPRGAPEAEAQAFARVRSTLALAIAQDCSLAAEPRRSHRPAPGALASPSAPPADFATYRRRYLVRQQAMEASIGPLRARVRATLASMSPDRARLAALDAVMERMLGARERALLSAVPVLLEKHFEGLRHTHQVASVETPAPDKPHSGLQPEAWLAGFCQTLQAVLLAELDLRLQPVEGLLAALYKKATQPT